MASGGNHTLRKRKKRKKTSEQMIRPGKKHERRTNARLWFHHHHTMMRLRSAVQPHWQTPPTLPISPSPDAGLKRSLANLLEATAAKLWHLLCASNPRTLHGGCGPPDTDQNVHQTITNFLITHLAQLLTRVAPDCFSHRNLPYAKEIKVRHRPKQRQLVLFEESGPHTNCELHTVAAALRHRMRRMGRRDYTSRPLRKFRE